MHPSAICLAKMTAEKFTFRWREIKTQLSLSCHLGTLLVRVLLHGLAGPRDSLLQIGGSSEKLSGGRHAVLFGTQPGNAALL